MKAVVYQEPFEVTVEPPTTFGIFDTFPNDSGHRAHHSGQVAAALMENENVGELIEEPTIEQVDLVAAKLPQ